MRRLSGFVTLSEAPIEDVMLDPRAVTWCGVHYILEKGSVLRWQKRA